MNRKIVFFGNCQCKYLFTLYRNQIVPFTQDEVVYIDRQEFRPEDEAAAASLVAAGIVVDQVFSDADVLTPEMLHPDAQRIRFPTIRGDFLWPYLNRELHPAHASFPPELGEYYNAEYGDSFLARMVIDKVPPEEAVRRYLAVDLVKQRHIDRIFELVMLGQRERDARAGIEVADFILQRFREQRLFESPGHPAEPLLALIARPVIAQLAGEAEAERALAGHSDAFEPVHRCPIHPGVIRHFGLTWVHEDSRYGMNGEGNFTFAEYALRYMKGEGVPELPLAFEAAGWDDAAEALALIDRALLRAGRSAAAHRVRSGLLRRLGQFEQARDAAWRAVVLSPEDPNNFIELASATQGAGQLFLAEQIARTALDHYPRNSEVVRALANILIVEERYDEALHFMRRAVDMLPSSAAAMAELARLYLKLGDFDQAEQIARRALALDPGLVSAQGALASALRRQGRAGEATATLRALIESGAADEDIYVQLANCLAAEENLTEAEEVLRAAPVSGHGPGARGELTLLLDRQGRRPEAMALLRELIDEFPTNPHLYFRMGSWQLQAGNLFEAEWAMRRVVELEPSSGARIALSDVLDRQNRVPEAIALLRDVVDQGGGTADIFARLGHLLWKDSKFPGAEAAFRRAAELAPKAEFKIAVADTLEKQGKFEEAAAILREIDPEGDDPQVLRRLGNILLHEDPQAAEATFRRAVTRDPSLPLQLGLVESVVRQSRTDEAIGMLNALIAEGHEDARLFARLGMLLLERNDFTGAEAVLSNAVRLSPDEPSYKAALARAVKEQKIVA